MSKENREILDLKKAVKAMQARQDELEKKVSELEKKQEESDPGDRRLKEDGIRILGFTLVKSGRYYHAVKTVDAEQFRIYLGKDVSDLEAVKGKIIAWLNNNSWVRQMVINKYPEMEKELVKK